ncbi:hypothetical protein ACHAP8_008746 [Fusarium lateritium]
MDGLHARYDSLADRSSELNTTTTIVLVLSAVFVALRFWARYVRIGYGLDDWLTVVALVFVFITGALNYGMISHGLGKHAGKVSPEDLAIFFKILLAFECIYVTAVMMVKLALIQMYLRIFTSRGFKLASAIIAATVVAWWIAICAVCIFQCRPIRRGWMPWLTEGSCIDLKASFIGNAIPNIATDIAILCLPVTQIVKLQVNIAQKLSLLVIFLLGGLDPCHSMHLVCRRSGLWNHRPLSPNSKTTHAQGIFTIRKCVTFQEGGRNSQQQANRTRYHRWNRKDRYKTVSAYRG